MGDQVVASDGHDTVQAKLVGLGLLEPAAGGAGWELTQTGRELLSATDQALQIHTRRGFSRSRHDRTGSERQQRSLVGIHAAGSQAYEVPAHQSLAH